MALSHANFDNPKAKERQRGTGLLVGDHILFAKVWYPAKPQTAWAMRIIDSKSDEPLKWKTNSEDPNGDMVFFSSLSHAEIKTFVEMMCHAAGLQGLLETYQEGQTSCWYEVRG